MNTGYATGYLKLNFIGPIAIADADVYALRSDVKEVVDEARRRGWIVSVANVVGKGESEAVFNESAYMIVTRHVREQGKMMVEHLEYAITCDLGMEKPVPKKLTEVMEVELNVASPHCVKAVSADPIKKRIKDVRFVFLEWPTKGTYDPKRLVEAQEVASIVKYFAVELGYQLPPQLSSERYRELRIYFDTAGWLSQQPIGR